MVPVMDFYASWAYWRKPRQLRGGVGATTAASRNQEGEYLNRQTLSLPPDPPPTAQRAALFGIVIALRQAVERAAALAEKPSLTFNIHTNSKDAIEIMTVLRHRWERRGWITSKHKQAANRDLVEEASSLHKTLEKWGEVSYIWITREENRYCYRLCAGDVDLQMRGAQVSEPDHQQSKSEVPEPVQQQPESEDSEPIHKQSEPEVSEPVQQLSESEDSEPVQQLSEPEDTEPVQQLSESEDLESVHKQLEPEVLELVQQQSEPEDLEPVRKQLEPEVVELIQQLSESIVSEPVQQSSESAVPERVD